MEPEHEPLALKPRRTSHDALVASWYEKRRLNEQRRGQRRRECEERQPRDASQAKIKAALAAVPPHIVRRVTTAYMLPKGRLMVYTATGMVCGKTANRIFVFVGSRLDRTTTNEMRGAFRRLEPTPPRGVVVQASQTTTRARSSHGRRPGHRRVRSSGAGPPGDSDSDGPGEAGPLAHRLTLAPPPKALFNFALSRCPNCGGVLLWHNGRLICATSSCERRGRPA
jgi:hypothetical protein